MVIDKQKNMTKEERLELVRKVGLFGLKDLRKLAPIGDIGYLNAIYFYRGNFLMSGLPKAIMEAFYEQRGKYGFTVKDAGTNYRCCSESYCPELGLRWGVDSSD